MTCLGTLDQFLQCKNYALTIQGKSLLLVNNHGKFYLLDNKCGHFGVSLEDAQINHNEIICAQHGISFNLETGLVVNRPYENCEPIVVHSICIKNNSLYCSDL